MFVTESSKFCAVGAFEIEDKKEPLVCRVWTSPFDIDDHLW